jgi:hypothetical protein
MMPGASAVNPFTAVAAQSMINPYANMLHAGQDLHQIAAGNFDLTTGYNPQLVSFYLYKRYILQFSILVSV